MLARVYLILNDARWIIVTDGNDVRGQGRQTSILRRMERNPAQRDITI